MRRDSKLIKKRNFNRNGSQELRARSTALHCRCSEKTTNLLILESRLFAAPRIPLACSTVQRKWMAVRPSEVSGGAILIAYGSPTWDFPRSTSFEHVQQIAAHAAMLRQPLRMNCLRILRR